MIRNKYEKGARPMSDLVKELLRGAETMFGEILNEVEPYNQPEHLVHMLLFRRFTEWQYEYCRAIGLLYEANCFQGAIPILRSLVEVTVRTNSATTCRRLFRSVRTLKGGARTCRIRPEATRFIA